MVNEVTTEFSAQVRTSLFIVNEAKNDRTFVRSDVRTLIKELSLVECYEVSFGK